MDTLDRDKRRMTSGQAFRMLPMDGSPGRLEGYASVFGVLSEELGGFRERIAPGAFSAVLESPGLDVAAYVNHEGGIHGKLGRTTSGTLTLAEDDVGLRYVVDLPNTTAGRDLAVLVERGDVTQSSFSFRVAPGGDDWTEEEGTPIRTVRAVSHLYDVSPVDEPAYPQTAGLTVRSLERFRLEHQHEADRQRLQEIRHRAIDPHVRIAIMRADK